MAKSKITYTICLEPDQIETIATTAAKLDLPPRVFARALILRGLRDEISKLEREA